MLMTATTAIPDAVRTGLARSLPSERPLVLDRWIYDVLVLLMQRLASENVPRKRLKKARGLDRIPGLMV